MKTRLFTLITICALFVLASAGCSSRRSVAVTKQKVVPGAAVAVIIDAPHTIRNVVMTSFLKKGFGVKAFSASDLYSLREIYDIRDYKKLAFKGLINEKDPLITMDKSIDNLYKLHIYNFEIHKAEMLTEMKDKWKVRYLVVLDLKNWTKTSWARAIDLQSFELIYIENYPTAYGDSLETIVEHFIQGMTGG